MRSGWRTSMRRSVTALVVVVTLAGVLGSCSVDSDPRVAVATTSMSVYDSTRWTPARGWVAAHPGRNLPTTIWYPTEGNGPWPLIVFAHGFNVDPWYYDRLLRRWAAAGYVVAAPEFPGSGPNSPGPARADDIPQQPQDLSVVITAMLGPGAPAEVAGKIDPAQIAAAGHSDGGSTVAALALNGPVRDYRVRSFLVLAGALPSMPAQYDGANTGPVLVVQGDQDPYNYVSDARSVYLFSHNPPKAFVIAPGAGHTDLYLDDGVQPDTVRAATVDWLNLTLKGQQPARDRFFTHASSPGVTELESSGL